MAPGSVDLTFHLLYWVSRRLEAHPKLCGGHGRRESKLLPAAENRKGFWGKAAWELALESEEEVSGRQWVRGSQETVRSEGLGNVC